MEGKFEALIGGLMEHQLGSAESFISSSLVQTLRGQLLDNFERGQMKPAGIGRSFSYEQDQAIRGDVIHWLEKHHNEAEKLFLEQIEDFIAYLNRTCYTGINAYEFHYALYPPGSFYKRHRDQFKSDRGRKFSLVIYLNENWSASDGGQLVLYPAGQEIEILPEAGRVVFFKSDEVEHEVRPARRQRLSIAGWLKQ